MTVLHDLISVRDEGGGRSNRPQKLHVIAHSMGNRIFLAAVNELYRKKLIPPDSKPLGQVILAAPDVDRKTFNQLIPGVIDASERVTYYYCQRDVALQASAKINQELPVGSFAFFQDGLDTICAGPCRHLIHQPRLLRQLECGLA